MKRAVVVGAGIVGTSAAFFLQGDGWDVTLLDPLPPGQGTSFGNAGIVSLGSVLPVGESGLWRRVPAMLRDWNGPLRLRLRDLPGLAPWLWRFLRASRPDRVEASTLALAPLLAAADGAHDAVIQAAGLGDIVHRVGWLKVAFDEPAMLRATARERAAYARFGIPHETLDAKGVRALEPALGKRVKAGLFLPQNRAVRSPAAYVAGIAEAFARQGGRIVRGRAETILVMDGQATAVRHAGGDLAADLVVLAAGAFSIPLARRLGLRLPLRAERGYHAMLPHPQATLARPVQCLEHGFVLAPMQGGLRLTSGVELAHRDAAPDFTWVQGLVPLARRYLPGLDGSIASTWLGHRPSFPDSLPVIGPAPAAANVLFAFGHQHVGLTLGPLTGRIIADLAADRPPPLDLAPYAPTRR